MPSEPRPKGTAKPAAKADVEAAAGSTAELPAGASLGQKPDEGLWFRLLGDDGEPVTVNGTQVRIP